MGAKNDGRCLFFAFVFSGHVYKESQTQAISLEQDFSPKPLKLLPPADYIGFFWYERL